MKYTHYRNIDAAADQLCAQGKEGEALALLQSTIELFPENKFENLIYQAYLYNNASRHDEMLALLEKMIQHGYFVGLHWRLWQPLKGKINPALIQENARLKALAQSQAHMEYAVHLPEGYVESRRYPLFLVLHGDGSNMNQTAWYWPPEAITNLGFILVYAQSSQVECTRGFAWLPNPRIAQKDIKCCYELVKARYAIDPERVIVGGFSGGAIIAVDLTLADVLPIKGFVCICPEMKTDSFTEENVRHAARRGVRGVFMEGEKVIPVPDEEEMMQAFREEGLPYQLYVNPGVGHIIPLDVAEKTRRAVDFIMQ